MSVSSGRRADSGEALLRRMAARRRRDNIVVVLLAVLAVFGGGHAIIDAFSDPPPGPSENSTVSLIGRSQLAESFARDFIVTYLSAAAGQQDRILEFVGGAQQATLPTTARQVSDPSVVYVSRELSSGGVDVWGVTVSVRLTRKLGAAVDDSPRQCYQVSVAMIEGRMRALSLPAAVEPPAHGPDLALNYGATCAADTPLAQVAAGFLQALLTGTGDIARYTTPNSGITALRPAPFTAADTATVNSDDSSCGANGSTARVLVSVNPKADGAGTPTLAYPLTMIREAGQWQVSAVDSVPALHLPLTAGSMQSPGGGGAASTTTTTAKGPASAAQVPQATQN
ncbi:conjugal transfer protein [Nocardia sp. NPDC056000]|uniref:conjugal transfer protein n=1 Tax=Nocardia sp. NPDC056000 TaxID=3345674 RepID=UPI0035E3136D